MPLFLKSFESTCLCFFLFPCFVESLAFECEVRDNDLELDLDATLFDFVNGRNPRLYSSIAVEHTKS